jgi:hypothetical protein
MKEQHSATSKQRHFKYQIWLMLIVVASVLLGGYLMVPKNEQQRQKMIELLGTTNQGELVIPSIDLSSILSTSSVPYTKTDKWKIVIVADRGCDDSCQEILFTTRQVHVLLSKLISRVERIFLAEKTAVSPVDIETLNAKYPHLKILPIDLKQLREQLQNSSAHWDMLDNRYFLVSPNGQAVLYYTQKQDGGDMLDDLKHLLKYSPSP